MLYLLKVKSVLCRVLEATHLRNFHCNLRDSPCQHSIIFVGREFCAM